MIGARLKVGRDGREGLELPKGKRALIPKKGTF